MKCKRWGSDSAPLRQEILDLRAELARVREERDKFKGLAERWRHMWENGYSPLMLAEYSMQCREALDPPRSSITESIDALRDAGGKAWDHVEDVEEELGRKEHKCNLPTKASDALAGAWLCSECGMIWSYVFGGDWESVVPTPPQHHRVDRGPS